MCKFAVVFVTFVGFVQALDGTTRYVWNCGAQSIHTVSISGCEDSVDQCAVKTNGSFVLQVSFTPQVVSQRVTRYLALEKFDGWVQFEDQSSCNGTGLTCPLPAGVVAHYSETMSPSMMPKGAFPVEWSILNENHEELACAQLSMIFL